MRAVERRRGMNSGGGTPSEGYIQSGLIFHLDGIDKGATDGRWIDLIAGIEFSVVEGEITVAEDGMVFSKTKMSGSWPYGGSSNYTVEVCYESTAALSSSMCVFGVAGSNTSCPLFYAQGGSKITFLQSVVPTYVRPSSETMQHVTCSCNTDRGLFNGVVMTTGAKDYWGMSPDNQTMYIGRGNSGSAASVYMAGTIHSIRIYNRKLSEAEMNNNQKIDNERFNLGLSL